MTPIGQAINTKFLWKHSESEASATGVYNIDKPILLGDLTLVSVEQVLNGRIAAASGLAALLSHWPAQVRYHARD